MPPDLDGTRVALANRYRLDAPIARGGMGTVWRGEDTLLLRPVAVKEIAIPPSAYGEEDAVRLRVMREAQAAARLSHPHTVTVFDVVEQDDRIWLVMELVEAGSLADLVEADGPIPPQRAAAIGVGLASALREAHRAGIIHRDVKPGNVLVAHDGGVKLTDFGIASLRDDPRITRTGMVLGSPSYMAPEQARGEPAGPAADVWGLGATLWYLVEGGSPFARDSAIATLGAIVNEPIPAATRAGPLGPVLARLLAKDPAQRPSLDEAAGLLAGLAGDGAAAVPVPTTADPTLTVPAMPATALAAPSTADGPVVEQRVVKTVPPRRRPAHRRSTSRWSWVALLVGLIAVLAGGLVAIAVARDDGGEGDTAEPPATSETTAATTSSTTEAPSTTATTAAPTTTTEAPTTTTTEAPTTTSTAAPPAGLPAGWVPFQDDATGFVIGHPDGWETSSAGANRIRFRDPSNGDSLLVEWTDDPGPSALGAWEEQAPVFASSHEGYREIRLEQVDYKGFDAAVWEFTWVDDGTTLHGHDLGMVTGNYGFALFSVAADSRWGEASGTFQTMAETFDPPT